MNKSLRIASILLAASLLGGCAAAVVGGAATGVAVGHDRRTTGTFIEDKEILIRAMSMRSDDSEITQNSDIDITVYNMQVLLTGQAQSVALVERLKGQIETIPRVRRVINEVGIGAQATVGENTSDAYLTARVKVALFDVKIDGFNTTRVKVTTSQGTVYLMGLLSREEADAATEVVRYVSGVKRVVKLFEYVD